MASLEQANSNVEPFWENYWCEEDEADYVLFPEEGDGQTTGNAPEKGAHYQKEVYDAGMRKVAGDQTDWKEMLKDTLQKALRADWGDLSSDHIVNGCNAIERAGKATCYVQRTVNSPTRITFHEEQIAQANNEEEKKYHEKKLVSAKKGKGGSGTGLLMSPKHQKGWFVITNNHVIMDEEEAQSAKVVFDYLEDFSNTGTRFFQVSEVVAKSLRTTNPQDNKTLDFSVLLLNVDSSDADANEFLEAHALDFEESAKIQVGATRPFLDMVKLNFLPMITFSHPHGLAKRISIGQYPTEIKNYPAAHIEHDLPTTGGSSGANLLFSFVQRIDIAEVFQYWRAGFVHYRHSRAIAWQAIGDSLRASLSSVESSHSAGPSTELGLPAESFHPPKTNQTEIVKAATKFESEKEECVRVLPYDENGQSVVRFYVFSGKSGIPKSLEEAAKKCFSGMGAKLEWIDLYKDAADLSNVTAVEYPSGVPKVLKAPQVDEISDIISKHLAEFDKHRNITSVQASFKVKDSRETENPCITIYVLGKGHIPIGESKFQSTLDSYPVDVVEGFWFQTSDTWKPNEAQTPGEELRFGASIGVQGKNTSGTLGAIVRDEKSGTLYALSCDHVMHPHDGKSEIIHPSSEDYKNYVKYQDKNLEEGVKRKEVLKEKKDSHLQKSVPVTCPSTILEQETALQTQHRTIGTYVTGLRRNVKWSGNDKDYFIDAAIAKLNVEEVTRFEKDPRPKVIGTGHYPSGDYSKATAENFDPVELCKSGRTTGYTEEGCLVKAPMFLKPSLSREGSGELHDVKECDDVNEVWWKNCLCIEGQLRTLRRFSALGDSGAVIFEKRKDDKGVTFLSGVGIHFAQHINPFKRYAIACPLVVALQALSQEHKDCDLRIVSNYWTIYL